MACNPESSLPELPELIVIVIVIPSSLPPGSTAPPTPTLVMSSLLYPPLAFSITRDGGRRVHCTTQRFSGQGQGRFFHRDESQHIQEVHRGSGGHGRCACRRPECLSGEVGEGGGSRGGGFETEEVCRLVFPGVRTGLGFCFDTLPGMHSTATFTDNSSDSPVLLTMKNSKL